LRAHFWLVSSEDSQETNGKLIAQPSKYPELRFLDRSIRCADRFGSVAFPAGFSASELATALGTYLRIPMLVWAFFHITPWSLIIGTFYCKFAGATFFWQTPFRT